MKSFDLGTVVEGHSWTWLLDLGRHLNVAINIVDDRCVPLLPIDSSSCLLSSAPAAFIFRATTRVHAGDSPWQMHN